MKKLKLKMLTITIAATTVAILPSLRVSAAWQNNKGNWYYLNEQGKMKTGWLNDKGTWYYLQPSGEMKTGWLNDKGTWYYLQPSGEMKTGWLNDKGTWYYLQPSGEMKTGWLNDKGTWYYLQPSGEMKTGWLNDKGTWYYLQPSGEMKTGWINDKGTWYFAESSGKMQTGVIKIEDKIYSLDANTGAMQSGNLTIDGENYVFAETGELTGKDVPKFTKQFNSNGVEIAINNQGNNIEKNSQDEQDETKTNQESKSSKKHSSSSNSGSSSPDKPNEPDKKEISYLENYRNQLHFSVPEAWGNDPNGMVYDGEYYHLFYQYYPDGVVWGPMHWGHSVSKDLIHWEDWGIALAPGDDEVMGKGTRYIYSGSAVVDKNNDTGLFDGCNGKGLVAYYTQHIEGNKLDDEECEYLGKDKGYITNTEEQCMAYSKDGGKTWIKYNDGNPVVSLKDDPLKKPAEFRDPKIFYNEDAGKWFMVVAGGPLRFYSSSNLIDWEAEAMQDNINTECPDFFKLDVKDSEGNATGESKWVLNEGGRFYRIGDFEKVDGKWTFTNILERRAENFGKDSYAAQTYYGTGENGTPDGRRIMINWMNNWDYCNDVGNLTGTFNGTYNLQNELNIVKIGNEYRLRQTPIKEYKDLRKSEINAVTTGAGATITEGSHKLYDSNNINGSALGGNVYEIVAEFTPEEGTKEVGFKLRTGNDQETLVYYNVEDNEVCMDRSKSGKNPKDTKAFVNSYTSEVTSEGKVKLHLFVDESCVEVYVNDGEELCSSQIFPDRTSSGIEVYSKGGNTRADIKFYRLDGIWDNGNSSVLTLSESSLRKEVGDEFEIKAYGIPNDIVQDIKWTISDTNVVSMVKNDNGTAQFKVIGDGKAEIKATTKDGRKSASVSLTTYNSKVPDNFGIKNMTISGGSWYTENNKYKAKCAGDGFATSDQINSDSTATYTLETDVKMIKGGAVGLTLYSQSKNPQEGGIVANVDKNGKWRIFKFPEGADLADAHGEIKPSENSEYHLKVQTKGKHITYWINGQQVWNGDQDFYDLGYFGIQGWDSELEFENTTLNVEDSDKSTLGISKTEYELNLNDEFTIYTNQKFKYGIGDQNIVEVQNKNDNSVVFKAVGSGNTTITIKPADSSTAAPVTINIASFNTDPGDLIEGLKNFLTSGGGKWYVDNDAYISEAVGDSFAVSSTKLTQNNIPDGTKYTLQAKATVINKDVDCAPTLLLFAKSKESPNEGAICFNINPKNGHWRIFEFGGGVDLGGDITPTEDGVYDLKVEVTNNEISYYINDEKVASTSENSHKKGYIGLMSWCANVEFRDVKYSNKSLNILEEEPASVEESLTSEEEPASVEELPTNEEEEPASAEEIPTSEEEEPASAEEIPTSEEEETAGAEETSTSVEEAQASTEEAPEI